MRAYIAGILLGAALLSAMLLVWLDGKPIHMRSGYNLPKEGHKIAYAMQLLVFSLFGWFLMLGCAMKLLSIHR